MPHFHRYLTATLVALFLLGCSSPSFAETQNTQPQQASSTTSSPQFGVGLFEGDTKGGALVADILAQDLRRGALISVVDAKSIRQGADTRPDWLSWRQMGVSTFLAGSVNQKADGTFNVRVRLWSLDGFREIAGKGWDVAPKDMRLVAHAVADFVQEKLSGVPGHYTERRMSISRKESRYIIFITDSDGADPQEALSSPRPILMPTWLSDKRFIAYVSLETSGPSVWMHEVNTGMRVPAGSAVSLVGACPAAARFLSVPPEVNPPTELLNEGWESVGGQTACKNALSTLAEKADATLARLRLAAGASGSTGPDRNMTYAERVNRAVRPNIVFDTSSLIGNPAVEIRIKVSADGLILESAVETSSSSGSWDDAALRAVRKTERLPLDVNGKVPPTLILLMRPLL